MQTAEALERVAYEFACDSFDDNVIYFEVRFAPQLHASPDLDIEHVLLAVNKVFTLIYMCVDFFFCVLLSLVVVFNEWRLNWGL